MRKALIYRRLGSAGTYAVTNGKVRYCSADSLGAWIDSAFTADELVDRALRGKVIGPINVNNFKEILR